MLDLDEIEERCEKATGGPWYISDDGYHTDENYREIWGSANTLVCGNYDAEFGGMHKPEDADFIIHAREDIPALIAEIRRLCCIVYGISSPNLCSWTEVK